MLATTRCLLLLLLCCIFLSRKHALAYKRPGCPGWPSPDDWALLALSLADSTLHGPFGLFDYQTNCLGFVPQKNVQLLKQGQGICMHVHPCLNQRCETWSTPNLPAYTLEAKSEADIQTALAFANTHDIEVSVKSSGHSYMSQSTARGSLLVWLRHLPLDHFIGNTTDTCGHTQLTTRVTGGEPFDDGWLNVQSAYHMVTGSCQTVSFAGGWILGGGMSWTMREFGYGVDQVQSFRVLKADGTIVTADACTETDLFWALRGGGGGNFGIVLGMNYRLHPKTKICRLNFKMDVSSEGFTLFGFDFFGLFGGGDNYKTLVENWLSFLLEKVVTLENKWGGSWGPINAELIFVGTLAEAQSSQFVADLDAWYDNDATVRESMDRPSSYLVEYDGYFEYLGGEEAYDNPDFDGAASAQLDYNQRFSRTIPKSVFDNRFQDFKALLIDMAGQDQIHDFNYIYGGKTMDVSGDATAIHPAMRTAVIEVKVWNEGPAQRLRDFLSSEVSSVCYNHHSALEPNIEEASWGSNFQRLKTIKAAVDPSHRFNVYNGVGFVEDAGCGAEPDLIEQTTSWLLLQGASKWISFLEGDLFDWIPFL